MVLLDPKDLEVTEVMTTTTVVLSLTEIWMVVAITVLTPPDAVGLRSYTPHLDLLLVTMGQFKETKLRRDPWSF